MLSFRLKKQTSKNVAEDDDEVVKETKTKKNFTQCSLKVSFEGHSNPQRYKNLNRIISFKACHFLKLYTLSK